MLLRFAVANFMSLKEEAEISFAAAAFKESIDSLIPSSYTAHGVVPVLALYGANASGKSNTLHSLAFLRWFVLNSFTRVDEGRTKRKPFALDDEGAVTPSRLELDFIVDGTRFQFGIRVDNSVVVAEWLYQYPRKTRQVLYERDHQNYKFGRSLTGSLKQIQSITPPNVLFISAAAKSGHPQLKEIQDYFRFNILMQLSNGNFSGSSEAERLEQDEVLRKDIIKYLNLADTGIADLVIEREPLPDELRTGLAELQNVMRKMFPSGEVAVTGPPETDYRLKIKVGHGASDGKVRFLDIDDESLGTQYLLQLLPSMLTVLRRGATLVLDEITTSLHTLLARQLVAMFHDKDINRNGAQLLFTTHDTNLLAPGILRRDEIWFAEKSKGGATSIYPLTDIKTKNTDNVERGYLQGRFGGIPFLQDYSHTGGA